MSGTSFSLLSDLFVTRVISALVVNVRDELLLGFGDAWYGGGDRIGRVA